MEQRALNRVRWQELIEEHAKSGLTQAEFCKQHNLVLSKFVYYRGVSKGKTKTSAENKTLVPIQISKPNLKNTGDIKIVLPNGVQCVVASETELTRIKQLVEVLLRC